MIKHKNKLIGIGLATIMLVSMVAVVSLSTSAAPTVKTAVGSAPSAVIPNPVSAAVFVKGSDGNLYWTTAGVAAAPVWVKLGVPSTTVGIASDPTVAVNGANDYVFVKGSDGTIWEISTANSGGLWTSWSQVSTAQLATGTGPGAVAWTAGDNRVVLFYVDSATNALQTTYQVGGAGFWSPVQNLGGYVSTSPAAVSTTGLNTIDVFVRGQSGRLWQMSYATGAFGGYVEVPGNGYLAPGTSPAVCTGALGPGTIDVFVVGGSLGLWQQHYGKNTATSAALSWQIPATAGATGYTPLNGVLSSSPGAASGVGAVATDFVVFADGTGVNNIWWQLGAGTAGGAGTADTFAWTGWAGPATSPS